MIEPFEFAIYDGPDPQPLISPADAILYAAIAVLGAVWFCRPPL